MRQIVGFALHLFAVLAISEALASSKALECAEGIVSKDRYLFSPAMETRLRSNEHAQEMERIAREIGYLIAAADTEELIDGIRSNDPEAIGSALGVPARVLIDYELRLMAAVDNFLVEFPEMALLMPKRPRVPDIREATKSLRAMANRSSTSIFEELTPPSEFRQPSEPKRRSSNVQFLPFPDPGDGDDDSPPLPPPTIEPPPDQTDPGDQVSCAYLPYIASLLTCGIGAGALGASSFGTGSLAYFACAAVAYCQFCEGGEADDVCDP